MSTAYIHEAAARLVRRADSRDPFVLAAEIGVHLMFRDDFRQLKGMYKIIKRNRFIFLNACLPLHTQRIVCAHELGHDALHRPLARSAALQEFVLYDMRSRPEYEANIFAAAVLLEDAEVDQLAQQGLDVEQIAAALGTDINLLLIKMNEMNKQGFHFETPYQANAAFLHAPR